VVADEAEPTPIKKRKPGPSERARLKAAREGVPVESIRPKQAPSPGGRRTRLETEIGAMLVQLNLGFMMTCALTAQFGAPLNPLTDPLQPNEIVLLAKGVAAQAEAHATFRKYLGYMLAVSGSAGLASVVGAIVIVRLSQHGVLPEKAGEQAALALQADPREVQRMVEELQRQDEGAA